MLGASPLLAPSPRPSIGPYWHVARRTFQRYTTYRSASFAGLFTNTVFAFLKAYILLAVLAQRLEIGSFDAVDVVTFTFVAEGLAITLGIFEGTGLGARIRTGDVVADLYRPLHFTGYWLAEDLGRAGFQLLVRGIPPVLIGACFFSLRLPGDITTWIAFAVSAVLATVASFAYRFCVLLSGFWLLDNRGPWQISGVVMGFFSGFVVPVTFFPPALQHIAALTPFPSMIQLPIEVFLGQRQGLGPTLAVLGQQLLWTAVLFVLAEVIVRRAVRRVVVQGG
ncbi:MAG: ABC transporter permease [Acidimicrobiales bacterium]